MENPPGVENKTRLGSSPRPTNRRRRRRRCRCRAGLLWGMLPEAGRREILVWRISGLGLTQQEAAGNGRREKVAETSPLRV